MRADSGERSPPVWTAAVPPAPEDPHAAATENGADDPACRDHLSRKEMSTGAERFYGQADAADVLPTDVVRLGVSEVRGDNW